MREGPPHVLMTADTVGGVWTYALDLCAALQAHHVHVTLLTMGRMPTEAQRLEAARHTNISLLPTDFRLEWMPDCRADLDASGDFLLRLERNLKPDLVHINGYWHAALPFRAPVLAAAHSCVSTWWHACRGSAPPAQWQAYEQSVRAAMDTADMVVAPSAAYMTDFQHRHGVPANHRVIWNGRNPQHFAPAQKHDFVLAAGRLWDEAKNIPVLCRAARGLDIRVAVAGEVSDPDGNSLALSDVAVLGRLSPAELAQLMSQAAIFAAPARYEPFGLGILEAALSGCALVLGDIPSLRELWDGAAEFVSPDDEAGLRSVLNRLARERETRTRLAQKARRRAQRFSLAAMGDAYERAYSTLLHGTGRTRHEAVA
jgi:glycosyltransferase involved in cell wall biosynthesis